MKVLLALAVMIGVAPSVARAQISGDISVNVNLGTPPGEAIGSVDVFYDQLSPYGVWGDDARGGRVFIPEQTDFVPYTKGHLADTDVGLVWVSSEPVACANTH